MADFFAINGENVFSMSSVYFDAIANYSRPYLIELSNALANEIYEPIDEAGIFVIGLTESSPNDFNIVSDSLAKGYDFCLENGKCGNLDHNQFQDLMSTWKNILAAIDNDDRRHKL